MSADRLLRHRARRLQVVTLALVLLCAAAAGGLGLRLAGHYGITLWWALPVAAAASAAAIYALRPLRWTPTRTAAWLDAQHPALEESTRLLLQPATGLAALQAQRVALRLPQARIVWGRVPGLRPVTTLLLGLVAALLAVPYLPVPAPEAAAWQPAGPGALAAADPPPQGLVWVEVQPPPYTRLPARRQGIGTIRAPEGSLLRFVSRDSLPPVRWNGRTELPVRAAGEGRWLAQVRLNASGFWQWDVAGNTEPQAAEAVPDAAPTAQLLQPEGYTEVEWLARERVLPVRVRLRDDYGLARAEWVLTLARGKGEGVKFTEQRLPAALPAGQPAAAEARTTLDLARLGAAPGDELYGYLRVWDNRPAAHQGRSETFLIVIADTAGGPLLTDFSMPTQPVKAYFRSQRQIIIDTEKLLAEAARLPRDTFAARSNNIGIDQKVLRLRYGQFLGEESETYGSGQVAPPPQASGADHHDHHDHDHDGDGQPDHDEAQHRDAADRRTAQNPALLHDHDGDGQPDHAAEAHPDAPAAGFGSGTVAELAGPLYHAHDVEEGATFYEEAVKVKLKAVLAQMWESELRLRTLHPADALPYQYRALKLLKELQQSERVYVRKLGFKLPPLRADKRLTGELDKVHDVRQAADAARNLPLPALRRALEALQAPPGSAPLADAVFAAAGAEAAQVFANQPTRYLPLLRALRRVRNEPACAACGAEARQALYRLLPPALPAVATRKGQAGGGDLPAAYFRALRSNR